jgi:hypothetical protein
MDAGDAGAVAAPAGTVLLLNEPSCAEDRPFTCCKYDYHLVLIVV